MKVKDLIKLLEKYPEAEVGIIAFNADSMNQFTRNWFAGIIYEDDGLIGPHVYMTDDFAWDAFDEDNEHGFKVEI